MTRNQHNRWILFFLAMLTLFVALFYAGCSTANADSPKPTKEPVVSVTVTGVKVNGISRGVIIAFALIAVIILTLIGYLASKHETW